MSDSASRVPISFSASALIMVTDACEPGFTPQAARCTASCKIPVSEHNKKPDEISWVFMAKKQGFVLSFCKAIRVKYFYALQKSSGSR